MEGLRRGKRVKQKGDVSKIEIFLSMYLKLLFTVLLASYLNGHLYAQEKKPVHKSLNTPKDTVKILQDSTKTKEDSLKYIAVEKFSKKSKATKYLHNLLFRSLIPQAKKKIKNPTPYRLAEGKIIREIKITTLDPFGYSIQDTTKYPESLFEKAGNDLHLKTKQITIKNLLLFKKDQRYDSLKVNESIRLIRSQTYVQDVMFYTLPAHKNKRDSVDVYIRVLDSWTIVPSFLLSPTSYGLDLIDYNLAGLGNTFRGETEGSRVTGENVTRLGYLVPNIKNTYISLNLQYLFSGQQTLIRSNAFTNPYYSTISSNLPYTFSGNRGLIKGIEVARNFYSPLAKWAGGIFLGQMITSQSYIPLDSVHYLTSLTNIQDYWGSKIVAAI